MAGFPAKLGAHYTRYADDLVLSGDRGLLRHATSIVARLAAIASDDVDRLRAILHNCVRQGPASQNRDGHADFRAHLRGRIAWVGSLDPAKGARLRAMFDQIRWDG